MWQNTRHVCVEGWDVIGSFGGYVAFGFPQTIGVEHELHDLSPSSVRTITYEGLAWTWRPRCTANSAVLTRCRSLLSREHGAPVRLKISNKIGYKQVKYLTDVAESIKCWNGWVTGKTRAIVVLWALSIVRWRDGRPARPGRARTLDAKW